MRMRSMRGTSGNGLAVAAAVLVLGIMVAGALPAAAEDIGEKLSNVPEGYAKAYTSPFIHAHGPNQNAGLYRTAEIPWGRLVFGVGVKVMGTSIHEDDQSFRLVYENVDLGEFDEAYAGVTGDVVMEGPTIFGDEDRKGRVDIYGAGDILIESIPTIAGVVDTRMVPLAAPEAYVGGFFGLKAVVRWLPTIDREDFGKADLFGFGMQWSASGLLQNLPVDLMIGFFNQSMDIVGEVPGYEGGLLTEASSVYLAASYDLPVMTVYGGYAVESSDMEVYYSFDNPDFGDLSGQEIRFKEDGRQESRLTLGANTDVPVFLGIKAKLNIEMAHGDFTTYSAGLMFGN